MGISGRTEPLGGHREHIQKKDENLRGRLPRKGRLGHQRKFKPVKARKLTRAVRNQSLVEAPISLEQIFKGSKVRPLAASITRWVITPITDKTQTAKTV
jgi:hypothetical protein